MLAPAGRQTYHRPYVYTCRRVHRPSVATLARVRGADCAPRRDRAALSDRDAGAHLVRHDARPPGGLRPRRGRDGAVGWGETWCNFPACGAEHRAHLLETVVAPLAVGERSPSPAAAFARCRGRPRCSRSSRASTGRWPSRSRGSTSRSGPVRAPARRAALAAARRQRRPTSRSTRAASTRTAPGPRRRPAQRRLSRVQAQGRLRRMRATWPTSRRCGRARCGGGADGRREPGLVARSRHCAGAGVRAVPLGWLEEPLRADRPARMAGARGRDVDPARRRRKPVRLRGVRRARSRRAARRRPARHREMGRHLRLLAGRSNGCARPACAIARTTSAPASASPLRPICWPRSAATGCSRSMRTRTRCAAHSARGLEAVADGFASLGTAAGIGIEVDPARLRALCI